MAHGAGRLGSGSTVAFDFRIRIRRSGPAEPDLNLRSHALLALALTLALTLLCFIFLEDVLILQSTVLAILLCLRDENCWKVGKTDAGR